MTAYDTIAVQTFCRLVQPKMGVDFTLNRTWTYDTIVGTGDMVRAVKKCRYYLRSFSTRRIILLAVVTFVEFSIFIQGEHGVFI